MINFVHGAMFQLYRSKLVTRYLYRAFSGMALPKKKYALPAGPCMFLCAVAKYYTV